MLIPASTLASHLTPGLSFEVRSFATGVKPENCGFSREMPYTEAVAMAIRGELEGIAKRSGAIKYLRVIPAAERVPAPVVVPEPVSKSTAFARTNMGVYREAVRATQMDMWGNVPTYVIIGHIWQLHGVRL